MKIVHICLCGPVTDNWSYQDNYLPKYHKRLGLDVSVITSEWIYNANGGIEKDLRKEYQNEFDIKTVRLSCFGRADVKSKFKIYKGLYKKIEEENPDILFVHGFQFIDILQIKKYIKTHRNVRLYVDNHADFSNSATNLISRRILHGIVWRFFAKKIEPYVYKFYGVLPARVDFLVDVYGLPKEKTELLVMGADDDSVINAKNSDVRSRIRKAHNIAEEDFLIVTGGKIDLFKTQTLLLMEAVKNMKENIKLIVFGPVVDELKEKINNLSDGIKVQYIGRIESKLSTEYFSAADLVVFPGRHSVFWEEAAGIGIPMVCKYWDGTTHIDVGGNVEFIHNDTVEEISNIISEIFSDKQKYNNMQKIAKGKGAENFLYSQIAKRSIQL